MGLSSWSTLIFTLNLVSVSFASVAIQPATVHPSRPNTCFIKETKTFYGDGDSWQIPGSCGLANCIGIRQPSGKYKMMISFEGCGAVGHEPGCFLEEDKTAEYPDCCPQVVCPDSGEYYSADETNTVDDMNNNDIAIAPAQKKNETTPENLVEDQFYESYYENENQPQRRWRDIDDNDILDTNSNWESYYEEASPDFHVLRTKEEDIEHLRNKASPKHFYWV